MILAIPVFSFHYFIYLITVRYHCFEKRTILIIIKIQTNFTTVTLLNFIQMKKTLVKGLPSVFNSFVGTEKKNLLYANQINGLSGRKLPFYLVKIK